MTVMEKVAPDPTAGRPCIARLTDRTGALAVHVQVDDRSLWLFAYGPKGGDRGTIAVPARRAGELLAWLDAGCAALFTGGGAWMSVRQPPTGGRRNLYVRVVGWTRQWKLPLDDDALAAFDECLRAWATAAEGRG